MTICKPVGDIRQPPNSVSEADDRLDIICCVGGQEPYGSVKRLGVPASSCGTGVDWTENILVPDLRWGVGHD